MIILLVLPLGPVERSTLLSTPFSLLGPASLPPKALFSGYKPTGLGIAKREKETNVSNGEQEF